MGLSEEDAREQEEIEVYATSFKPMKSSFAGAPDRVMMKLVVSVATRKVLISVKSDEQKLSNPHVT